MRCLWKIVLVVLYKKGGKIEENNIRKLNKSFLFNNFSPPSQRLICIIYKIIYVHMERYETERERARERECVCEREIEREREREREIKKICC